ncbi:MAG: hypothetical protein KAS32_11645 [Candidatus Peribacteraceae bacterium]|nr:hypothetical protein [Candidatus Peribacteraceae bacterium]
MPVKSTTKKVIKNEVIEANGFEIISIHIFKPVESTRDNPARLRIVWGCTLDGIDTGEIIEVSLKGKEALDYITSDIDLYNNLLVNATALGKAKAILPDDVV